MNDSHRQAHMDVTNQVDVTDYRAVNQAVRALLDPLYPEYDFAPVDRLFHDFDRLYDGRYPGFHGCDIQYHNAQHVLDVTLAMARLMHGHDTEESGAERLGPELLLAGVALALFHDSGYIRRTHDSRHKNGAAYTHIHVNRSARFLEEYLPEVGLERLLPCCTTLVHFTTYLLNPADIQVDSARERRLGELLGTADLIAQMADVDYLRKLRTHLYAEFEAGGMAGRGASRSHTGMIYKSPDHLLSLTPDFIRSAIDIRLEDYFGGVYRYVEPLFDGRNLYLEAIHANRRKLESLLAASA